MHTESATFIAGRRRLPPLVAAVGAGAGLLALLAYAALHPAAPRLPAAPPAEPGVVRFAPESAQLSAVKAAPVELAPLPLAEPLSGRVALNENATARISSPISGRVVSLRVQPGDRVKAGDVLAVLSAPELAAARADLEKAAAEETRRRLALERARELFEAQVLARRDLESAIADQVQARAERERAVMRLRNLTGGRGADGAFTLRAPITGVVVERQVNPASEVRPDQAQPLFTITDPTRLWVVAELPERALARVKVGGAALVESDAYPGRHFPATVERIGETVDAANRRLQLRLSLPNPARELRPEMYARVTLAADTSHPVPRVPNAALVTEGLKTYVFVERSPGEFVRRAIVLQMRDREASFVAEGLAGGERVVVSGALLLNAELREGG